MSPLTLVAGTDAAWTFNCAFLALFVLAGLALVNCGLVRRKNAAHVVMLSLSAYIFALLAYYTAGYALQFGALQFGALTSTQAAPALNRVPVGRFLIGQGKWGLVGGRGFFLADAWDNSSPSPMFHAALVVIAASLIVGAICERITFWAFVGCELFVGGILYPIFGCWVWGAGWLSQIGSTLQLGHGYVDVAGSSVVHAVGGFGAMALAIILGPRLGKYGADGRPRPFPAHNIVFVAVGTLVLLVGWMGIIAGSALQASGLNLGVMALNTNLAAVAGAAAAMLFWYLNYGKPDISMTCNGLLAGLVAVSASCAFIGPTTAVAIGALAGLLVCGGVLFNERVLKIDDPSGSVAVHGYCGWFGAVAVGIFADGMHGAGWNGVAAATYLGVPGQGVTGLLHGDVRQFVAQLGGATLCALYTFGFTYLVFRAVDQLRTMRVEHDVELEGLDLPEFGMLAYPDDEGFPG